MFKFIVKVEGNNNKLYSAYATSNYHIQGVMQMDDWVQRLYEATTANNNTDGAAQKH